MTRSADTPARRTAVPPIPKLSTARRQTTVGTIPMDDREDCAGRALACGGSAGRLIGLRAGRPVAPRKAPTRDHPPRLSGLAPRRRDENAPLRRSSGASCRCSVAHMSDRSAGAWPTCSGNCSRAAENRSSHRRAVISRAVHPDRPLGIAPRVMLLDLAGPLFQRRCSLP